MTMEEKISAAIDYAVDNWYADGETMAKNDAANIYASTYEEYVAIWAALRNI